MRHTFPFARIRNSRCLPLIPQYACIVEPSVCMEDVKTFIEIFHITISAIQTCVNIANTNPWRGFFPVAPVILQNVSGLGTGLMIAHANNVRNTWHFFYQISFSITFAEFHICSFNFSFWNWMKRLSSSLHSLISPKSNFIFIWRSLTWLSLGKYQRWQQKIGM